MAVSVLFDAVFIPGGATSMAILKDLPDASAFIGEAFLHAKVIAADGERVALVETAHQFWEKKNVVKKLSAYF